MITTDQNTEYRPDIAIPPGETLQDTLDYMGITQRDLSFRTSLSEKHISQIVNGEASITPETAMKFELVLNVKASFWNNLEARYRENLARIRLEKSLAIEEKHLSNFECYRDLVKLGYTLDTRNKRGRVESLLKFFGVNSLMLAPSCSGVDFRGTNLKNNKYCLAAWIRCGQIIAEKTKVENFSVSNVKKKLRELRRFTSNSGDFGDDLIDFCKSLGVIVALVPLFKGTHINGAAYWHRGKPVIQLNVKGKRSDIFWFSFFHELAHIILHGKKDKFLEFDDKEENQKECEADEFASDILIPLAPYKEFLKKGIFSMASIEAFALKIDVDSSIVAGRLGHDGFVTWSKVSHIRPFLKFV